MQPIEARDVVVRRACGHQEEVWIEGDDGRRAWLVDRLRWRSCPRCRNVQTARLGAARQTEFGLFSTEPVTVAMQGSDPRVVAWARHKRERLLACLADHGLRGPEFQAIADWVAAHLEAKLDCDAKAWVALAGFDARSVIATVAKSIPELPPATGPARSFQVEASTLADPEGVYLMRDSTHCFVLAPRNTDFLAQAGAHGGRWCAADRVWSFPLAVHEALRGLLAAVYGRDGLSPAYQSESVLPVPPPSVLHPNHADYAGGLGSVETLHHLMPLFGSELQVVWGRQIRASLYGPRNIHDDDPDEFEAMCEARPGKRAFLAITGYCGLDAHRWIDVCKQSGYARFDTDQSLEFAAQVIEEAPGVPAVAIPAIMPEITVGTDRQIAYAMQVRFEVFHKLAAYGRTSPAHVQIMGLALPGLAVVPGADAQAWIDRRESDVETLVSDGIGEDKLLMAEVRRLLRPKRSKPAAKVEQPATREPDASAAARMDAILGEASADISAFVAEMPKAREHA